LKGCTDARLRSDETRATRPPPYRPGDLEESLRHDINGARSDLGSQIAGLRSEVAVLRADLAWLEERTRVGFVRQGKSTSTAMANLAASLRAEIETQGQQLRSEMETQGQQLRSEMGQLRTEMKSQGYQLRTELHRDAIRLIFALTGMNMAIFGSLGALAKFF
jgi:DNA anti-recombination protein RmuC